MSVVASAEAGEMMNGGMMPTHVNARTGGAPAALLITGDTTPGTDLPP